MAPKPQLSTYEQLTAAAHDRLAQVNKQVRKERKAREDAKRYFDYHAATWWLSDLLLYGSILCCVAVFLVEFALTNTASLFGETVLPVRVILQAWATMVITVLVAKLSLLWWARHINKEWPIWSSS